MAGTPLRYFDDRRGQPINVGDTADVYSDDDLVSRDCKVIRFDGPFVVLTPNGRRPYEYKKWPRNVIVRESDFNLDEGL